VPTGEINTTNFSLDPQTNLAEQCRSSKAKSPLQIPRILLWFITVFV